MPSRIALVVGASGIIGSSLARELLHYHQLAAPARPAAAPAAGQQYVRRYAQLHNIGSSQQPDLEEKPPQYHLGAGLR